MTGIHHSWKVDWPTSILASVVATVVLSLLRFPVWVFLMLALTFLVLTSRLPKMALRRMVKNTFDSIDRSLSSQGWPSEPNWETRDQKRRLEPREAGGRRKGSL